MTVEEFFQRVSVAGKAFTNAKCTQEQYLRYLANKLADVDPELGIDCNRIRVTPETAPRWPGLWKRINLAVGLIQKRKAPVENFPSYVHGLLMDFRMDLRETPAEKTKRAGGLTHSIQMRRATCREASQKKMLRSFQRLTLVKHPTTLMRSAGISRSDN